MITSAAATFYWPGEVLVFGVSVLLSRSCGAQSIVTAITKDLQPPLLSTVQGVALVMRMLGVTGTQAWQGVSAENTKARLGAHTYHSYRHVSWK